MCTKDVCAHQLRCVIYWNSVCRWSYGQTAKNSRDECSSWIRLHIVCCNITALSLRDCMGIEKIQWRRLRTSFVHSMSLCYCNMLLNVFNFITHTPIYQMKLVHNTPTIIIKHIRPFKHINDFGQDIEWASSRLKTRASCSHIQGNSIHVDVEIRTVMWHLLILFDFPKINLRQKLAEKQRRKTNGYCCETAQLIGNWG